MGTFNNLYREALPKISDISTRYSRSSGIPKEFFISTLSETMWKCYLNFDTKKRTSFSTLCNTAFRNAAINIVKSSHRKHYQLTESIDREDNKEDEGAPKPEPSTESLEVTIFERKKKIADQRQLIDYLLESAKIQNDPMALAAIQGVMDGRTINDIASTIGVHHSKIQRLLKRLARCYDVERFGDIRQYMPDGFEVKRDYIEKVTA